MELFTNKIKEVLDKQDHTHSFNVYYEELVDIIVFYVTANQLATNYIPQLSIRVEKSTGKISAYSRDRSFQKVGPEIKEAVESCFIRWKLKNTFSTS